MEGAEGGLKRAWAPNPAALAERGEVPPASGFSLVHGKGGFSHCCCPGLAGRLGWQLSARTGKGWRLAGAAIIRPAMAWGPQESSEADLQEF